MKEIWKEINGYKISNYGTIIGKHGRPLSAKPDKDGYVKTSIDLGDGMIYGRHRIIATVFIPNYENLPEVNHMDANKENNRWDNLEWCTHKHNMRHVSDNQLYPKSRMACVLNENNKIIEVYNSTKDLNVKRKFRNSTVFKCCEGTIDTCEGIKIRYYDEENNDWIRTRFDNGGNSAGRGKYKKKFICTNNKVIYSTQAEASNDLEINASGISNVLQGKQKQTCGYVFKYLE